MNKILQKRIEEAAEQYSVSWRKNPDGSEAKEMFPVAAERCFKAGATFALQNQWISVNEALPEEEKKVLVAHQYRCQVAAIYKDDSHSYWGVTKDSPIGASITHWMPIPSLEGGEK